MANKKPEPLGADVRALAVAIDHFGSDRDVAQIIEKVIREAEDALREENNQHWTTAWKKVSRVEAPRCPSELHGAMIEDIAKRVNEDVREEMKEEEKMRKLMGCEHPQACWVQPEPARVGLHEWVEFKPYCSACELQAQAVKEAIEKEREACAVVAGDKAGLDPCSPWGWNTSREIAADIRRRGERKLISDEEKQG